MPSIFRWSAWLASACAAALAAGGCGGSDPARGTKDAGGGRAIVSATSAPDYLDPALSYTALGWQALWTVYTPLLTYAHEDGKAGTELVPGLARALPQVSTDGRTYRLRLRSGLRYSDGAPVRASDFEHTIKRVLNLESQGSFYYLPIVGAEDYVENRRARADIAGIESNDETGAITIRLTGRDGTFANVLALDFAGLVPGDTPFRNLSPAPPPGVGPYRIDNVRTNRSFDLVKVAGFDVAGIAPARLDRITLRTIKNRRRQTQDTIQNKIDYMIDPPAPDQIRDVRARFGGGRYREFATASTYFYFLNQRVAPFDDERVRQAVNFAVDRRAVPRLYGGLLAPSCNFLPPQIKGHVRLEPCPYGEAPDVERARSLVRAAGVAGDAVAVFAPNEPEPKATAEYMADVLSDIGLKARPRIIDGQTYFATVGNQKSRAQIGFTAFSQDFPHPSNFTTLIDGRAIQPTNSPNFGNVDDPQITAILERAGAEPDLDAVAGDYADVDRRLLTEAHVVPLGNRKLTVLYSDRVDADGCTHWHPVYGLDLTRLCLR